ncbi:MAG: hypothetical protein WCJ66_05045 [Verrucomicrobiota bacterium]
MKIGLNMIVAYVAIGVSGSLAETGTAKDFTMQTLSTDGFSIGIDNTGHIRSMTDASKISYSPANQACPILGIVVAGKTYAPTGAVWSGKELELSYEPGVKAKVEVAAKPTHITFELLSLTPNEKVEMVIWGPYTSTANQRAGAMTGLLWGDKFGTGLQVLNTKTLYRAPGQPENVLSAYCRDRERPTDASAYGHTFKSSFPGEGVAGSKIALFGCAANQMLSMIEAIELAESLPHVTLNGKWVKALPGVPYLGFEFGEDTIDQFIKVAQDAGIPFIYHPSAWETWGHFEPKKAQFPNGREGFKACVDKAHKAGLRVGVHTLGTFITSDDAYVTPKADPRLACSGGSKLSKAVAEREIVIEVTDGAAFSAPGQKKIIRIGTELVSYGGVKGSAPATLEGCERGAFGTTIEAHLAGTAVDRLIATDFFTPIFLGNRELNHEIAQRAANNCIEWNLDKYEFDGVEGTMSCGLDYAIPDFVKTWYDALGHKKGKVMLGGSGLDNYTNHIMDCVNWGEPWGAEFRKGMLDYRFMRMDQYRNNLLPHMLGQYAAQMYAVASDAPAESSRCRAEDVEWLMALRCGHDAGFSLTFTPDWNAYLRGKKTSPIAALMMPNIDELAKAMHAWETAYQANAFPADVKTLIGDRNREFHMVENGPASWTLYPLHVASGNIEAATRIIKTDNPHENAPVNFVIFNLGSPVSKLALKLPGNVTVPLEGAEMNGEEIIRYTGGEDAVIYGRNWNKLRTVKVNAKLLTLAKGPAEIAVDWAGDDHVKLTAEIRLVGPARQLTPQK